MKIPYKKTRQFITSELPGVLCDPPLIFEFASNPPYKLTQALSEWLQDKDATWEETRRLAAELIKAVIVPDGTRYPLGTPEEIDSLAEQTEQEFVANLLNGWQVRVSLERMADVKKLAPSHGRSSTSDGEISPQ